MRSILALSPDARIALRASPHGSSRPLYEVDVNTDDGHLELMLKDLSPTAELPQALGVRPTFLYQPLREISVYRHLLAPNHLGARYFGCRIDRSHGLYLLLIERTEAAALDYHAAGDAWDAALRWIADLHALAATQVPRTLKRRLRHIDGPALELWLRRGIDAVERTGSTPADALERLRMSASQLVREFDQLEQCMIHGELYASNVLVDPARRVIPVDWELAAIGPAGIDVAAITSGRWGASERDRMIEVYRVARASGRSDAGFARQVDLCRLFLALQWCGWSDSWQPPADESQDWIGEALEAAVRLGVL